MRANHSTHLVGRLDIVLVDQNLGGLWHVGHDADLASVVGQALIQNVQRRSLKYGSIQGAVDQQTFAVFKAARIVFAQMVLVHVQAIFAG